LLVYVYVRFIGDGSIQEKDFGHIQIDRIKEMKEVARNLNKDEGNLSNVKFSIVAANNHYAGFGPGTKYFQTFVRARRSKMGR
jgi:hypothetical protein